jgi:hypothetical protein
MKWGKDKREKQKRWPRVRLSSSLSGVNSFPCSAEHYGRWAFGLFIRWCNVLWPCFVLCASVPSRMDGTCARICVERGGRWHSCRYPRPVEVWTLSWWNDRCHVGSERGSRVPVHCAWSCPSHRREWALWWEPPWLPILSEGFTCPSGETELCQDGRALPCLRCMGRTRRKSFPTGRRG